MTVEAYSYGDMAIPGRADEDEPVGDSLLGRFVTYVAAYLNAYGASTWKRVCPHVPVVVRSFTHDPSRVVFNTEDLPALYLWRTKYTAFEQIAEDYRVATSELTLLWIMPPEGEQDNRRVRLPFRAAIPKLVDHAIEKGRDPCYLRPGDPDPTAVFYGSVVFRETNLFSLYLTGANLAYVQMSFEDDDYVHNSQRSFEAVQMTFELKELDTELADPSGEGTGEAAIAMQVTKDGLVVAEENLT